MLHQISLGVSNIERAAAFYDAALAPRLRRLAATIFDVGVTPHRPAGTFFPQTA
jgi:catechol 2,3-dioxygenase-like lactoylglutathione lyase family enzyme